MDKKTQAGIICWAVLMSGAWLAFGKTGLGICIIIFAIMMMAALTKIKSKK